MTITHNSAATARNILPKPMTHPFAIYRIRQTNFFLPRDGYRNAPVPVTKNRGNTLATARPYPRLVIQRHW